MAESSTTPPETKTYRGNCHCGLHVFEADIPEITKADTCSCSIHAKIGAPWGITKANNVRWLSGGLDSMETYAFANKKFPHKFCGSCGTPMAWIGHLTPPKDETVLPQVGLNIRTFQHGQIPDIWDMETTVFDGANFGEPYKVPEYTGPEPSMDVEGGKLYTGSCHCGAVKVALKSKPLDATFTDDVYECNCSGCIRAAGCCVYPHKDQVIIEGEENTKGYSYGSLRAWEKFWCKTCGIFIGRRPLPMSDEVVANLPEMAKKWTVDMHHLRPLNLRIMNGVDLKDIKTTHIDGYNVIPPKYVNP